MQFVIWRHEIAWILMFFEVEYNGFFIKKAVIVLYCP